MFYVINYIELVKFLQATESHIKWEFMILTIIIVRSLLCCCFCATRSEYFIKLIKLLDLFDVKTISINNTKKMYKETIRPILGGGIIISIILAKLILSVYYIVVSILPETPKVLIIVFSILSIWEVLPMLLYLYFSSTIRNNLEFINEVLLGLIPNIETWYLRLDSECPIYATKEKLRNVRMMHISMSDAIKHLSASYGSFLAIDQVFVITMYVINLYLIFFVSNSGIDLVCCIILIIDGLLVLAAVYVSHDVTDEVSFPLN